MSRAFAEKLAFGCTYGSIWAHDVLTIAPKREARAFKFLGKRNQWPASLTDYENVYTPRPLFVATYRPSILAAALQNVSHSVRRICP